MYLILPTFDIHLYPRAHLSPPEGPTRGAQVGGPTWGPSGWAHVGPKVGGPTWGPKWVGPRGAQVGPSQKFGTQKIQKIKILKIKIRSAQNVGKVWISRKKSSWPHLGPSGPIFCVGRKNPKIAQILPIFLGGPMGPIHPVWGPCCYPPEVGQ